VEEFLDQDLSNVLVSRQGEIFLGSWKLGSPSKREIRKIGHPKSSSTFIQACPGQKILCAGDRISLSHVLPPLPPVDKVVGSTFRSIWVAATLLV
jgi:hypothetical protein